MIGLRGRVREMNVQGSQFVFRLLVDRDRVSFNQLVRTVDIVQGEIIAVDFVRADEHYAVQDVTVSLASIEQAEELATALRAISGVKIENVSDRTFLMHLGGKIDVMPRVQIKTRDDLSHVYTPGVARVVQAIADDPYKAFALTMKRNSVAIVTDGTAILGLGDLGALASLPVMEGKAVLFRSLAEVNAFPLCLDTKDVDEFVETVVRLAPAFGGINLEDISSPRCFEIERRLQERLDIPVFHDDQHGTAAVILAGLINAARVVGKELASLRVVVAGIGAAGTATTNLLLEAGIKDIIGFDKEGPLTRMRTFPDRPVWDEYARRTNPDNQTGSLRDILTGADVFIGLSIGNLLTPQDLEVMAEKPIVFALANPVPEIDPVIANRYAAVVATGRSDFPNQVNNVLCFPGLFRGVLDCRARVVNMEMKLAAAQAIASVIGDEELSKDYIIPSVFNRRVAKVVARAVQKAAEETHVARR